MQRKVLALKFRGYNVRAQKSTCILNHIKLRVYCKLDSCICLRSYLTWPSPVPIHLPLLPFACTAHSTPLPLSHIRQAHPRDHPLPPLSAVQSLLTELSPDGKRERKQLSAALSQPERNSPPTAARLTGLYCLILSWRDGSGERERSVRTRSASARGALHRQTGSVFPLRESSVMR